MLTGQNGILNRAGEAKTTNGVAQGEELIKVSVMDALTRGTGELTDENLRKALSSNLGTEGKDYEIVGNEEIGWTVTIKENEKDYKISSTGKIGEIEKVEGKSDEWEVVGNAVVKYLGNSDNIVIPNYVNGTKITEIGEKIFYNSEKTGTLTISEGIKTIDTYAFADSKFTGELVLPSTLKEIGEFAFAGCSGFKGSLSIPGAIKTISKNAFISCTGFDGDLIINEGVEAIGEYTFCNCQGFKGNLIIASTVKEIGGSAFLTCKNLTGELKIPDGVEIIGDTAFLQCGSFSGNLTIPDSVKEIGNMALYGLNMEGTLDLGNGEGAQKTSNFMYLEKVTKVIFRKANQMTGTAYNMQYFKGMKSCWISSEMISSIDTYAFKVSNENDAVIYTNATQDDPNWPVDWNPNNFKVVYNTPLSEYEKITY